VALRHYTDEQTLAASIHRLRSVLNRCGNVIETVAGVGYRFVSAETRNTDPEDDSNLSRGLRFSFRLPAPLVTAEASSLFDGDYVETCRIQLNHGCNIELTSISQVLHANLTQSNY